MAFLEELSVGIPGAGRRTLLSALQGSFELPEDFRLCVLDAERLTEPRQLALLDELAADPELRIVFALNKADRITGPRTVMTQALALLRERGFSRPEIFLLSARAALLFRQAPGQSTGEDLISELGDLYFRFGPGEQSLSVFSVTRDAAVRVGSRELSPEQLRLALENTGLPMLEARLRSWAEALETQTAKRKTQTEATGEEAQKGKEAAYRNGISSFASPRTAAPVAVDADKPAAETATDGQPEAEGFETAPAAESTAYAVDAAAADDAAPGPASEAPAEDAPQPEASASDNTPGPELELLKAWAAKADCAELLEMARRVGSGLEGSEEIRNEALDTLHAAYLAREKEELEALTRNTEGMDLSGLRALVDRIKAGAYTVQGRTPYIEKLNHRIDDLQAKDLAALCSGVEQADARTLSQIRETLERVDCAEVLKTEHFRRIEARQEQLDVGALERVTAGAEKMNEKELRALAVTLEAKNWNPKYVGQYRHRIELCREAAVLRELEDELADLDDMERREVTTLREHILSKELPLRLTAAPLTRIDEKLYRMDMLRLIALNNDFDSLSFEELDVLRAQVGRGEWCERARNEYLARLLEREKALIIENTDARAQLVRQLIGQYKLRMTDFAIASASPAYEERLNAYWGGSGMEQPRDLPVFILDNASDFALTAARFYYKTGRDLAFLPLDNIERFQTMRQHMSLFIQVVGKDSSYRLTGARLGRSGAERVLAFLNECVRRWNEPGLENAPSVNPIRIQRFEPGAFTAPVEQVVPDQKMALELFRGRCLREKLREGNLIREGEDGWEQRTRRLLQNFDLPENTPLIWYCSSTLLGTVREGVALGPRAIYQKEGKLPTQIIPLQDITELSRSGKHVTVSTVHNQSFRIELPQAMLSPVQDYIKAIQLSAFLREGEKRLE